MSSHRKLSLAAIVAFAALLAAPALPAPAQTADALFAQARTHASVEHKNVLMVFSASWCGPCRLFDKFLEDPQMKSISERAFIVERIDVGEQPGDPRHSDTLGGVALRTNLGAVGEPGFPFLVITSDDGKPIVNSYRNGHTDKNVGYPASREEIDWYIQMLKRAAPSLSSADLAATQAWLQNHSPH